MTDDKNRVSAMKLIRAVETIQRGCSERKCGSECPLFDEKIRVCILISTRAPQFYRVPTKPTKLKEDKAE
jgi:hypothetical protein